MTPLKPWYVGLPCRTCGQRVTQNAGGLFVQPVDGKKLGEPWAEHGDCRKEKR